MEQNELSFASNINVDNSTLPSFRVATSHIIFHYFITVFTESLLPLPVSWRLPTLPGTAKLLGVAVWTPVLLSQPFHSFLQLTDSVSSKFLSQTLIFRLHSLSDCITHQILHNLNGHSVISAFQVSTSFGYCLFAPHCDHQSFPIYHNNSVSTLS